MVGQHHIVGQLPVPADQDRPQNVVDEADPEHTERDQADALPELAGARAKWRRHAGDRCDNDDCDICRFNDAGEIAASAAYMDTGLADRVLTPAA